MIIDLQRRIQEAGRIRIGQQVQASGGKTRPAKLDTFRLTSADRTRIDRAAALFGGTVREWEAPAGKQWEVITEADTLDVIVPPSEMAFSQWYEQWSAGGCQRRCDGQREQITDGPCLCDPDDRACDIHTRLSVMLADLPGLGVWRIDTSGYYAAVELSGAVQVVQAAAGRGTLLPARLRLEQRSVKRPGRDGKPETRRFAVPVLDIEITPAQLVAPRAAVAAIEGAPAPSFQPVPAALPTGPQQSIAEQAAPPTPKPPRANAAPEIPSSGRRRGATPPPDVEPIRDDTKKALFAELNRHGITDRAVRLAGISRIVGRPVKSSSDLTEPEARAVLDDLRARPVPEKDPATSADEDVVDAEVVDEPPGEPEQPALGDGEWPPVTEPGSAS